MSIRRAKKYLYLILHSSQKQSRALLETASVDQGRAISEIIYNLLSLPLNPIAKDKVTRRRRVLRKLANKQLNTLQKLNLMYQHSRLLYDTLMAVKEELMSVIDYEEDDSDTVRSIHEIE